MVQEPVRRVRVQRPVPAGHRQVLARPGDHEPPLAPTTGRHRDFVPAGEPTERTVLTARQGVFGTTRLLRGFPPSLSTSSSCDDQDGVLDGRPATAPADQCGCRTLATQPSGEGGHRGTVIATADGRRQCCVVPGGARWCKVAPTSSGRDMHHCPHVFGPCTTQGSQRVHGGSELTGGWSMRRGFGNLLQPLAPQLVLLLPILKTGVPHEKRGRGRGIRRPRNSQVTACTNAAGK